MNQESRPGDEAVQLDQFGNLAQAILILTQRYPDAFRPGRNQALECLTSAKQKLKKGYLRPPRPADEVAVFEGREDWIARDAYTLFSHIGDEEIVPYEELQDEIEELYIRNDIFSAGTPYQGTYQGMIPGTRLAIVEDNFPVGIIFKISNNVFTDFRLSQLYKLYDRDKFNSVKLVVVDSEA